MSSDQILWIQYGGLRDRPVLKLVEHMPGPVLVGVPWDRLCAEGNHKLLELVNKRSIHSRGRHVASSWHSRPKAGSVTGDAMDGEPPTETSIVAPTAGN